MYLIVIQPFQGWEVEVTLSPLSFVATYSSPLVPLSIRLFIYYSLLLINQPGRSRELILNCMDCGSGHPSSKAFKRRGNVE